MQRMIRERRRWRIFCVCGLFSTAVDIYTVHCADELQRVWKEAFMAYLKYYQSNCLAWLKKTPKTSVRTVGAPAEIRTQHLPNTSLDRYHYASLLCKCEQMGPKCEWNRRMPNCRKRRQVFLEDLNTKHQVLQLKTQLRGFSPEAINTDRATAACWRS
jgi:hypothetical protein